MIYFCTAWSIPERGTENRRCWAWYIIQKSDGFSPPCSWDPSIFNFSRDSELKKKTTHRKCFFFLLFDRRWNMQLLTVNYRIKIINRAELTKGNIMPITLHSKILWIMQCKILAYKKNMLTWYHLVIIHCFVSFVIKFHVERMLKRKNKWKSKETKNKALLPCKKNNNQMGGIFFLFFLSIEN